jgi:L-threonylcarbamoyladenylate synthase
MTAFEEVIARGGVVLFPSDTVYGLACDPENAAAIERLYALKGRPAEKASAVMFFDLEAALAALPELGPRTQAALRMLMPGAVTLLVPNPSCRFPLACGDDPDTLGLRVVSVPALAGVRVSVLQSSANPSGGRDARNLSEVAPAMRAGADLVIDGGDLPGTPSTVVDLRWYEGSGAWSIVRAGRVSEPTLAAALNEGWGFDPDTYYATVRDEIPGYEEFQAQVVSACFDLGVERVLELGTGTGETARRVLAKLKQAELVGVDESAAMLAVAAGVLPAERVQLVAGRLQDGLPDGRFDLVVSALATHHLDGAEKADLFARVLDALAAGGRFVLGDVIVPDDPTNASIPLTPGFDKPSTVAEQVRWLADAGFASVEVVWERDDLAVLVADQI